MRAIIGPFNKALLSICVVFASANEPRISYLLLSNFGGADRDETSRLRGLKRRLSHTLSNSLNCSECVRSNLGSSYEDALGGHTFIPWLDFELKRDKTADWFCFLDPTTTYDVNVWEIQRRIYASEKREKTFLVLADELISDGMTGLIIHHFNSAGLEYAKTANFLINRHLGEALVRSERLGSSSSGFVIDPVYEFFQRIRAVEENHLLMRTATYPIEIRAKNTEFSTSPMFISTPPTYVSDASSDLSDFSITFAVKTTKSFHQKRLPVFRSSFLRPFLGRSRAERIEKSVGALHLVYMTDATLDGISEDKLGENLRDTVLASESFVNLGIENTKRGHCRKMQSLLRHLWLSENFRKTQFFIVSDDDTLWDVEELIHFLETLDSRLPLYAGERYGYTQSGAFFADSGGYDYITTGGGLVLTRSMLDALFAGQGSAPIPMCNSPSEPDDMALGRAMQALRIPAIHCGKFHQRRPWDYPKGYLEDKRSISFHNIFSQVEDPVQSILKRFLLKND